MDVIGPDRPAIQEAIAEEVRALLARRRLSGNRAAMRLGWKQTYLSRRLTGAVPFDVADLMAIANLLEVPVTHFLQVAGPDVRKPGSCPPLDVAA